MLYVRALEEDFNEWGLEGWDWAMALEHYKVTNSLLQEHQWHIKSSSVHTLDD
jgi:hypothetical protein